MEYAKYKGLNVIKAFRDEGVSGGLIERPGMQEMLTFLKRHTKREPIVVIIDDISRLARGLDAHIQLRSAINSAGGRLESPSIEFGEDSDSILVENLLASVSQHSRQKNAEQVIHRMRARTLNGYWCFYPPLGYKYKTVRNHGKMIVRHEPVASIVTEALEGFASGRFDSIASVKRFLEAQPAYPKNKRGEVHFQRVQEFFKRVIYAGYIDVAKWGISLQPGKHEPLISFETWKKIQHRLEDRPKLPTRRDLSVDFPLRGLVSCGCCDHPMTAAWSKGRNAKYPYYLCQTKDCSEYRKSIKREIIEQDFEVLLKGLRPASGLFQMAHEMLRDLWQHQLDQSQEQIKAAKQELLNIERKTEKLIEKILDADSQSIAKSYEKQMKKLDETKIGLSEKMVNFGRPKLGFDQTYRTALKFLSNPYELWASERIEDKRLVLKLAFSDHLPYIRGEGYRTAKTTLPFKVLGSDLGQKKEMVGPVGLEPTTRPL